MSVSQNAYRLTDSTRGLYGKMNGLHDAQLCGFATSHEE